MGGGHPHIRDRLSVELTNDAGGLGPQRIQEQLDTCRNRAVVDNSAAPHSLKAARTKPLRANSNDRHWRDLHRRLTVQTSSALDITAVSSLRRTGAQEYL